MAPGTSPRQPSSALFAGGCSTQPPVAQDFSSTSASKLDIVNFMTGENQEGITRLRIDKRRGKRPFNVNSTVHPYNLPSMLGVY